MGTIGTILVTSVLCLVGLAVLGVAFLVGAFTAKKQGEEESVPTSRRLGRGFSFALWTGMAMLIIGGLCMFSIAAVSVASQFASNPPALVAPANPPVNPAPVNPAPVAPVNPPANTGASDPWGLSTMSVADAQQWLSKNIGGSADKWTPRNDEHTMWGYWDQDHKVTFRHPGNNSMLTYWNGFPEPQNARGCWVQVPKKSDRWDGTTRTVQCPTAGATFEADGVGFHPVAPNN